MNGDVCPDHRCVQVFWSSRAVRGGASVTHSEAPPTEMLERSALIFMNKKVTTHKGVQPGNTLITHDNKNND